MKLPLIAFAILALGACAAAPKITASDAPDTNVERMPSADPTFEKSKQQYIDQYYKSHPAPAGTSIRVLSDLYFPMGGESVDIGPRSSWHRCSIASAPAPGETTQRVIRTGKVLYITGALDSLGYYPLTVQGGSKIVLKLFCEGKTARSLLGAAANGGEPPLVEIFLPAPNAVFKLQEINYSPRKKEFKLNEI